MKIWKSILSYCRENSRFIMICVCCMVLLFLIMKSETQFTDAYLCAFTVVIAARSYKKQKNQRKQKNSQLMLENYLEKLRYELSESRQSIGGYGGISVEAFEAERTLNGYYYRLFCTLRELDYTLGCQNNSGFINAVGMLQETVIKEYDLRQNVQEELSGLKWIILISIPVLPAVRAWVVANISELDSFYKGKTGILLKYGIWIFALLIFMIFDRLEEIKSEKYI